MSFLKNMVLHMLSIDISLNITSASKELNHDNVTYMLCMLMVQYQIWLFQLYDQMIKCLSLKFKICEM
jgi:hypothetical protein